MRCVYQVYLVDRNPKGTRLFINLEAEYESVEAVHEALEKSGCIYGDRLRTTPDHSQPNTMEIIGRDPVVLTVQNIAMVQTPTRQFTEYEQ